MGVASYTVPRASKPRLLVKPGQFLFFQTTRRHQDVLSCFRLLALHQVRIEIVATHTHTHTHTLPCYPVFMSLGCWSGAKCVHTHTSYF